MWKSLQELREPWRTIPGWEFDLLRALPPETARRLYQRALFAVMPQMWQSRMHWVVVGITFITCMLTLVLVWAIGAALGFGPFGRFVLEVAFHVPVGVAILHPLGRRYQLQMQPYVRAALAEELMNYAEDALAPPPSRRVRPKRRVEPRSEPTGTTTPA